MSWVILTFWTALAYATELSDRTLAARATLTGTAMFVLNSDIASRSGSSWATCIISSSRVSMVCTSLDVLDDVPRLLCNGDRGGIVTRHVECDRCVDRNGDVRVEQRHRL